MTMRNTLMVGAGVLAALMLVGVSETEARQPADAREPPAARPPGSLVSLEADHELLRQVMVESRVATDRSRPGLTLWAQDAGLAFSRWMAGVVERALPGFNRWLVPFIEPAMRLLLMLLVAVLLIFLTRYAFERWRRRTPATREPVQHLGAAADAAAARDWEGELRRQLERGDVAASTRALWWWLAGCLVGDRAEPSWTSRELAAKAGRRDLSAGVRRLDRMMYGAARPQAGDVRRLWSDLREMVE